MINTIVISSFILLVVLLFLKVIDAVLHPRRYLRNDDDPFKVGTAAYFQYGPGSDNWKERYGQRE